MGRPLRPREDDATRGLTLRELVLEARGDIKDLKSQFGLHKLEHAEALGKTKGEAKVFGMARSGLALIISLVGIAITVAGAVGPVLAGTPK